MGRNLFDFSIANSSNKFFSGKSLHDGGDAHHDPRPDHALFDASLCSTASSSAESQFAHHSLAAAQGPPPLLDMGDAATHRTRSGDHSSRGDRRPLRCG